MSEPKSETKFPIYGRFTSKRGIEWIYCIYNDLRVEQYRHTKKRKAGGWKAGRDIYSPHCTKELKNHIKESHGLEVWSW